MNAYPVSTMPFGPRRSGSRLWYGVRMSDGSIRCFGSAASGLRYIVTHPSPALADQLRASLKEAA